MPAARPLVMEGARLAEIYDYENDCKAICPLTGNPCMGECMWMRPTALGEPKCAAMVIADELVNIHADLTKRGAGDGRR